MGEGEGGGKGAGRAQHDANRQGYFVWCTAAVVDYVWRGGGV